MTTNQTDLEKENARLRQKLKETTELLEAVREQRDRIIQVNGDRITVLEKALTEARKMREVHND